MVTPARAYVVLAYLFSWAWWLPMALSGTVVGPGQGWPTHLPGLLGPALAAVVVTAAFDGRAGLGELWSRISRWRVPGIWYLVIVATAALAGLPLLLGRGGPLADLWIYSGAPVLGMVTVLYVIVLNGFGEEIGWRGFLAQRLLGNHSVTQTALRVWVVWGLWHLPLFWIVGNFRDLGPAGIVGWSVGLLAGSIFLTWMYNGAARSILIVALWHTAYNFTSATQAGAGLAAAVSSTIVMVAAVVIVLAGRRGGHRAAQAHVRPAGPVG